MHASVMRWIAGQVAAYDLAGERTLEVGSLNVNGSVRSLFNGDYLGVDMQPGPGVDRVVNAHDLGGRIGECFEVIVSTEMLEHDDAPWLSLDQMRQVIAEDGWLLLTCRGYDHRGCFPVHSHPDDLWRFTVAGVEALLRHTDWTPVEVISDPEAPGVFAAAQPAVARLRRVAAQPAVARLRRVA